MSKRALINHTRPLSNRLSGGDLRHTSIYISEQAADYLKNQAAERGMSQSLFLDIVLLDHERRANSPPTSKQRPSC